MRVGVIGVGSMGQNHARVYNDLGELVGVVDRDMAIAKKVASRFGTKAFDKIDDLLRAGVDCVTIATPTETHCPIAKKVISKGVHALIEKPLAMTSKDGMALVDIAKRHGVTLAVGHIERHNPVVKLAKEFLLTKEFGDLISISSRRVSSFPERIRDVGVIHDMGTHDIDVSMYLVASEVERVYAVGGSTGMTKFEDHAGLLITFEDGINAFIEVNWLTPFKVRKIWLTCSKNFVEMDYMAQTMEISSSRFIDVDTGDLYHIPQEYAVRRVSLKKQEPLKNELQDFISAVEKKKRPLVTGEDGVKVIRVAEAATKSLRLKKPIRFGG
jgi:UDP-N-acetylglucosamine 3-dehydrogenase